MKQLKTLCFALASFTRIGPSITIAHSCGMNAHGNHLSTMHIIAIFIVSLFLFGCATNPISGDLQLDLISDKDIRKIALINYNKRLTRYIREGKSNTDPVLVKRVTTITNKLVDVAKIIHGDARQWSWKVNVIDENINNASCLHGGKMFFYTGLINNLSLTDDEIAQVMAHEVSHALLGHSKEKISIVIASNMAIQSIILVAKNGKQANVIEKIATEKAIDTAILKPYQRGAEIDSDSLGIKIAALAGYDPAASISLWEKMRSSSKHRPVTFLSTHPSPDNRIENLNKFITKLKPIYEKVALSDESYELTNDIVSEVFGDQVVATINTLDESLLVNEKKQPIYGRDIYTTSITSENPLEEDWGADVEGPITDSREPDRFKFILKGAHYNRYSRGYEKDEALKDVQPFIQDHAIKNEYKRYRIIGSYISSEYSGRAYVVQYYYHVDDQKEQEREKEQEIKNEVDVASNKVKHINSDSPPNIIEDDMGRRIYLLELSTNTNDVDVEISGIEKSKDGMLYVPEGKYTITASKTGYETHRRQIIVPPKYSGPIEINLLKSDAPPSECVVWVDYRGVKRGEGYSPNGHSEVRNACNKDISIKYKPVYKKKSLFNSTSEKVIVVAPSGSVSFNIGLEVIDISYR